jgi:hypothetical protein
MITKVDICNMALSHLGMQAITTLLEDNPSTRACNKFYDPSLDAVLSEFRWPFATVKQALVGVTDETLEMEWDYIYVYPTQALRIWNVYNESTIVDKDQQEFEVVFQVDENRKVICSNNDSAYAEYSYRVQDTNIYDPLFNLAFSLRMAGSMAHTLIGDAEVSKDLLTTYANAISDAKRMNSIERIKKPYQTSSYVNSRG